MPVRRRAVVTVTAPVCEVVERDPIRSRHPLATQSGVNALLNIIAADRVWRPVAPCGKWALRRAYSRALAEAQADGLTRIPLPKLGDDVHRATVRSLERRGLAADGALTSLAVAVLHWALPLDDERRQRPVDTVQPTGGVL